MTTLPGVGSEHVTLSVDMAALPQTLTSNNPDGCKVKQRLQHKKLERAYYMFGHFPCLQLDSAATSV
jgi:hypothetical protein